MVMISYAVNQSQVSVSYTVSPVSLGLCRQSVSQVSLMLHGLSSVSTVMQIISVSSVSNVTRSLQYL